MPSLGISIYRDIYTNIHLGYYATTTYLQFLGGNPSLVIPILLYSHLDTLFAASIYFRKEIIAIFDAILSNPFNYRTYATGKTGFLITALLFTGLAGIPILYNDTPLPQWLLHFCTYGHWSYPDRVLAFLTKEDAVSPIGER